MTTLRTFTTYLALTTLLLSHVAGWMHVGCAVSGGSTSSPATEAVSHACCCHHALCDPAADGSPEPGDSAPEHDSDQCSVCQSFLALRNAISVVAAPVVRDAILVERYVVPPCRVDIPSPHLDGLSVRGPPRV